MTRLYVIAMGAAIAWAAIIAAAYLVVQALSWLFQYFT